MTYQYASDKERKALEARVRRAATRLGYRLSITRRYRADAPDYGASRLLDGITGECVIGTGVAGATLEEIAVFLSSHRPDAPIGVRPDNFYEGIGILDIDIEGLELVDRSFRMVDGGSFHTRPLRDGGFCATWTDLDPEDASELGPGYATWDEIDALWFVADWDRTDETRGTRSPTTIRYCRLPFEDGIPEQILPEKESV